MLVIKKLKFRGTNRYYNKMAHFLKRDRNQFLYSVLVR